MPRWLVECRYLGGWGDAGWTDDDKPHRFKTKKEAEAEIDQFIEDVRTVARTKAMTSHDRSEYRAIKEKPDAI